MKKPKTTIQEHKSLIWAVCIVLSITIAGCFVFAVFPYHYSGELDCEADLGELGLEYEQRFREEHPTVTRYEPGTEVMNDDGRTATATPGKTITYKDTNQTEFRQIPIKLDIDGISGVKLHCKGKLSGTFPLSLLSRMG